MTSTHEAAEFVRFTIIVSKWPVFLRLTMKGLSADATNNDIAVMRKPVNVPGSAINVVAVVRVSSSNGSVRDEYQKIIQTDATLRVAIAFSFALFILNQPCFWIVTDDFMNFFHFLCKRLLKFMMSRGDAWVSAIHDYFAYSVNSISY